MKTVLVMYRGRRMTLAGVCARERVSLSAVRFRMEHDYTLEEAIALERRRRAPVRAQRPHAKGEHAA